MAARELPETAAAAEAVMAGKAVHEAAREAGISPATLYRAVERRQPGWFKANPLTRKVEK